MTHPLYLVDAFASQAFAGNPAAVCVLGQFPGDAWMQSVAAEINQSETAFLCPRADGDWDLRWFTPLVEVDLCGHATLASAHVLWQERGGAADRLRFHTRSGVLVAKRDSEDVCLDFPQDIPTPVSAEPTLQQALQNALGASVIALFKGRDDYLVLLEDEQKVASLVPDMSALKQIECRGVIVTAPSTDKHDFVSRFFGPRCGIEEDPATGSAHCTLAGYWAEQLNKDDLLALQLSRRGAEMAVSRRGERVELRGKAVITLKGALYV